MNFLEDVKTVAIIGLSRDEKKPSHQVAHFLQKQGIVVVPINPHSPVLLKEKSYATVFDVPKDVHIDVVAIYRNPEAVEEIVKQIILRGDIKTIWFPQGAENMQAELQAFHRGITVITNFCLLHEYKELTGKKRLF
jgi:predicted CoA-binding protein